MQWLNRSGHLWLALGVLLVYLSPNIFFPEKARFVIHDNLDSNVLWYKNLAESGQMFSDNDAVITRSLNGVPRGCYPSSMNFMHLFYLWFDALTAYNVNIILMHLFAFMGMRLLLGRHVMRGSYPPWLITFISLIFALLPFWPSGGLAVAGQPLLLFAFLNILGRADRWMDWLVIAFIPFYSLFVLSNLFFIGLLSVCFLIYSISRRQFNWKFPVAIALFVAVTIITEHRLFEMQFIRHFENHRENVNSAGTLNTKGVIGVSILHFLKGQYHFHSLQFPFTILLALTAVIVAKGRDRRRLLVLLAGVYAVSILFILPNWNVFQPLMKKYRLLGMVSLRFYAVAPLMWFLVLGMSCAILYNRGRYFRGGLVVVLSFMGIREMFSISDKDYFGSQYAENAFYRTYFDRDDVEHATFPAFYKTALFSKVASAIPPGDYYVGCIGIYPEIAQFNRYNTIDGYFYYFPKAHFDTMVRISRKELDKSQEHLYSRCYIWSDDYFRGRTVITSLDLDYDLLWRIGTRYIFSTRRIIHERLTGERGFAHGTDSLYTYRITGFIQ